MFVPHQFMHLCGMRFRVQLVWEMYKVTFSMLTTRVICREDGIFVKKNNLNWSWPQCFRTFCFLHNVACYILNFFA